MTTAVTSSVYPITQENARRATQERRRYTIQTLYRGLVKPRRRHSRRASDTHPVQDYYGWTHMLSAIALIVFSCTDASFTLLLLLQGGEELNPVMNYFLGFGNFEFFAAKMVITLFGIFCFVACWNLVTFARLRVRNFMFFSLGMYSVLIVYEIYLLRQALPGFLA